MSDDRIIQSGQRWNVIKGSLLVSRVAKDASWADITVCMDNDLMWTKRQKLVDGRFPFRAELAVKENNA